VRAGTEATEGLHSPVDVARGESPPELLERLGGPAVAEVGLARARTASTATWPRSTAAWRTWRWPPRSTPTSSWATSVPSSTTCSEQTASLQKILKDVE